jgi:hypothetical protein
MIRSAGAFGLLALMMACGSEDESKFVEQPPPLGGNPEGGLSTTTPPTDDCTAEAKLAYVLSEQNDLYSFAPDKLTFAKVGPLACPGTTKKPYAMTVERSGTAWVSYTDGKLFKVSTKDASCTDTGFVPSQLGFLRFALAFATNGTNTKEESLYYAGLQDGTAPFVGKGLGTVDRSTLKLAAIADFSAPLNGKVADLTGTGDGKLYGFFNTTPATLAVIDRATAATSNLISLTGVDTGNAYAFNFWGGEFYLYTAAAGAAATSKVTKVKPTGEVAVVMESVGPFRIVGAGVSTCAPLEPIVR